MTKCMQLAVGPDCPFCMSQFLISTYFIQGRIGYVLFILKHSRGGVSLWPGCSLCPMPGCDPSVSSTFPESLPFRCGGSLSCTPHCPLFTPSHWGDTASNFLRRAGEGKPSKQGRFPHVFSSSHTWWWLAGCRIRGVEGRVFRMVK